jgi:hypothetical protein
MGVSGKFSISHDTLARSIFSEAFLTKNPDFEFLREEFKQCQQNYKDEVKKQGCSCRVDNSWSAPCLVKVLDTLETGNKTNHDMIRRFVRFISRKEDDADVDGLGVNIIYGEKTYAIMIDTDNIPATAQ